MRKVENHCVDCGLPCLGKSCRYIDVPVYYCNKCGDEDVKYVIDEKDYCEDCVREYLQDVFDDLTITEKVKVLEVDIFEIDG